MRMCYWPIYNSHNNMMPWQSWLAPVMWFKHMHPLHRQLCWELHASNVVLHSPFKGSGRGYMKAYLNLYPNLTHTGWLRFAHHAVWPPSQTTHGLPRIGWVWLLRWLHSPIHCQLPFNFISTLDIEGQWGWALLLSCQVLISHLFLQF